MRISDWSSDVCSSDLGLRLVVEAKAGGHRETEPQLRVGEATPADVALVGIVAIDHAVDLVVVDVLRHQGIGHRRGAGLLQRPLDAIRGAWMCLHEAELVRLQTGRASCRESVGQYV